MNIPVLLEPIPTGFRASTGAPLNLVAEAATEEQALKAVRLQLATKLAAGAKVVDAGEPLARFTSAWDRLAADPQHDQFLDAMAEYRKEREAEDAEPAPQPEPGGAHK
jgi:hypothetical protein